MNIFHRPWGSFENLKTGKNWHIKTITKVFIPKTAKHRLSGVSKLKIVEISFGKFDENDIERYEDDFGRIGE